LRQQHASSTQGAFWHTEDSLNARAFKPFPQATRDQVKVAQYLKDWSPSDGDALRPLPGNEPHLLDQNEPR
jgi:hypothetical protein